MPIKATNDAGEEVEAFLPEEVKAKDDALAAKDVELATIKAEAEKYKRVASEQTTNFKKFNELSEAERNALSSEKIEAMKRSEASEAKLAALEQQLNTDTQTRIKTDTELALSKYHGGDAKLKEALEKNFQMINLEGTDTATIYERAKLAASMEKGKVERNPLNAPLFGDSPRSKELSQKEEFEKSDKYKAARRAMGEKVD